MACSIIINILPGVILLLLLFLSMIIFLYYHCFIIYYILFNGNSKIVAKIDLFYFNNNKGARKNVKTERKGNIENLEKRKKVEQYLSYSFIRKSVPDDNQSKRRRLVFKKQGSLYVCIQNISHLIYF